MDIRKTMISGIKALLLAALIVPVTTMAKERVVFSGGPAGGTFQVVANAMQVYKPIKE